MLTTYGRSSGFCVDPIEKKPLNHFLPGHAGAVVRHGRLQPGVPVLPELGHLQVAEIDTLADRGRRPRRSPEAAQRLGCRQRRVHLQRPGDLPRVRDRRRRRLPRARHQGRRGHGRLHLPGAARASSIAHMDAANVDLKAFTEDFYQRRLRRPARSRCSTRSIYLKHETDVWFEITTLLIPGQNDSDARARRDDALGRRAPRARTCRCTSPRSTPTSRCSTAAHAAAGRCSGAADRDEARAAVRLHRQRARRGGAEHLVPRLRGGARRARLVRDQRLGPDRRRPLPPCGRRCPGVFDGPPGGWGPRRRRSRWAWARFSRRRPGRTPAGPAGLGDRDGAQAASSGQRGRAMRKTSRTRTYWS